MGALPVQWVPGQAEGHRGGRPASERGWNARAGWPGGVRIASLSALATHTSLPPQNRPSVITCASASARNCNLSHCPVAHSGCAAGPASYRRTPSSTCDPVVEEHFRRSLGKNYKEPEPAPNSVSITGSVDDHFAKALGDTWLQIKAAKDGASSSPESASRRGQPASPSAHMVSHSHSPSVVS